MPWKDHQCSNFGKVIDNNVDNQADDVGYRNTEQTRETTNEEGFNIE